MLYELVKFGFLFSAKAAMPTRERQEYIEVSNWDVPRTLLLICRRKRHMEQPTFSPQSLRQALLKRYNQCS
jgi:hypothetical protein